MRCLIHSTHPTWALHVWGDETWNDFLSLVSTDVLQKDSIIAAVPAIVDGAAANELFLENQTEEGMKEEPNDTHWNSIRIDLGNLAGIHGTGQTSWTTI
jgi:hypothetical protein